MDVSHVLKLGLSICFRKIKWNQLTLRLHFCGKMPQSWQQNMNGLYVRYFPHTYLIKDRPKFCHCSIFQIWFKLVQPNPREKFLVFINSVSSHHLNQRFLIPVDLSARKILTCLWANKFSFSHPPGQHCKYFYSWFISYANFCRIQRKGSGSWGVLESSQT